IRDFHVTGVQTCALPISARRLELLHLFRNTRQRRPSGERVRCDGQRLAAEADRRDAAALSDYAAGADRILRRRGADRLPATDSLRAAGLSGNADGVRCRARRRAAAQETARARAAGHHPPQARDYVVSADRRRKRSEYFWLRNSHPRPLSLIVPEFGHALLVRTGDEAGVGPRGRVARVRVAPAA